MALGAGGGERGTFVGQFIPCLKHLSWDGMAGSPEVFVPAIPIEETYAIRSDCIFDVERGEAIKQGRSL